MDVEKENKIILLIEDVTRFCQVYLKYRESTLSMYRKNWYQILKLMSIFNIESIDRTTESVLLERIGYVKTGLRHCSSDNKYMLQRSLKMLVSFNETRNIPITFNDVTKEDSFVGPLGIYCDDYLQYLSVKLRRSKITVDAYKNTLYDFCFFLRKEQAAKIEDLNIAIILEPV